MNTSAGTLCLNGTLVYPSQCPAFEVADACTCVHPGVNCISNCSSDLCLCANEWTGTRISAANNTVCVEDALAWPNDPRCSSSSPVKTCMHDGFYCTSPCSITYYYCVYGRRMPDQFVPFGTVCESNGKDVGSLVNPEQCSYMNTTSLGHCDTEEPSFQCIQTCSDIFYYCVQYKAYIAQMAPTGLLCYENTFVLASDPVCVGNVPSQEFPIVLYSGNESLPWSVLYQYELASALATSLSSVGLLVRPSDIYFPSAVGRILFAHSLAETLSIHSADPNLDKALALAMHKLPAILASNNLAVSIALVPDTVTRTVTTSTIPTVSPSAVARPVPTLMSGSECHIVSTGVVVISVLLGGFVC